MDIILVSSLPRDLWQKFLPCFCELHSFSHNSFAVCAPIQERHLRPVFYHLQALRLGGTLSLDLNSPVKQSPLSHHGSRNLDTILPISAPCLAAQSCAEKLRACPMAGWYSRWKTLSENRFFFFFFWLPIWPVLMHRCGCCTNANCWRCWVSLFAICSLIPCKCNKLWVDKVWEGPCTDIYNFTELKAVKVLARTRSVGSTRRIITVTQKNLSWRLYLSLPEPSLVPAV